MENSPNIHHHAGWEHLFQNGAVPPRYLALAPPDKNVIEWADGLPAASLVLDVGCGLGRHMLYLGERGFRVAGIDLSPTGVETTRAACAERQITVDARVGDMTTLPWEADTFDAALSIAVIHHNLRQDILKAMGEIRRVLKPGGLLLVDFPHKETLSFQRVLQLAEAGKMTQLESDTYADTSATPDLQDDEFLPHHYSDEADVRDMLRDFDLLRLIADLPDRPADGGLGQRGRWVAWARKP
jgi:SAM-dependent methyltransferase